MAKKAIQTLRRGDDGRMKLVYLDLETQQPIEYKDIGGYEIVTAEGGSYWNPNFTQAPKPQEVTTTPKTDRVRYSSEKNGTQGVQSGGKAKKNTNPIDNFGYFDKPKWMKAAALIPGKIGAAAKLANVAVNANNAGAVNRAREMLELPPVKGKGAVKSLLKDQQGQVANGYINGEDYSIGFEALSPSGKTNLTPDEARKRALTLGGFTEGVSPTADMPEEKGKKKSVIEKITGLGEGWLGDFLDKKFGKDEKGTDKPITPTEKKVLQMGGGTWGGDMPIGKQKDDIVNRPASQPAQGFIGRPSTPNISYEFGKKTKRNQIPSSGVGEKVGAIAGKLGLKAHMYSGQEPEGAKPAGTAHRHPEGYAGDFYFTDRQGNVVRDPKVMEQIALEVGALGGNAGLGPEYMGRTNMHLDTMPIENYPGHGQTWGSTASRWKGDMAWAKSVQQNPRPASPPTPTARPEPLSLDPVGESLNPIGDVEGTVFDRIGPKGTFSKQAVSDVPTSFVGSTPARIAALGMTPRTPEQVDRMSRALAGELSPEQLAGLKANDPIAQRELANMVTTIENRAASAKYGTLESALNPSQYNSLMTGNLDVTNGNYSIYGSTLSEGINDYYTGALKPDNYDFTSYYNADISNPSWGPGMSDRQKVGDHTFGALPEYRPSSEFRDRTGLLSGSNRPASLGSENYNKGNTPHSIERGRDMSLRESSGRNSLMDNTHSQNKSGRDHTKESSGSNRSTGPSHTVERGRDTSLKDSNKTQKTEKKEVKESKTPKESGPGSERF